MYEFMTLAPCDIKQAKRLEFYNPVFLWTNCLGTLCLQCYFDYLQFVPQQKQYGLTAGF